jgi:hypothetical protein
MKSDQPKTEGRKRNAAQDLGDRKGLVATKGAARTAATSRIAAGPDGPDAGAVGTTFKTPAGKS